MTAVAIGACTSEPLPRPVAIGSIPSRLNVKVGYEYEDYVPPEVGGFTGREFAAGGLVKPLYLAGGWTPKGTDTVPAMLTPGERVLTVAQNRAYERGTVAPLPASVRPLQITVISQIGRREFARSVVNLSPNEFELAGL